MKSTGMPLVACSAGVLFMLSAGAGAGEIKWGTSYRDAKKVAKESGRLMMIDFWADW